MINLALLLFSMTLKWKNDLADTMAIKLVLLLALVLLVGGFMGLFLFEQKKLITGMEKFPVAAFNARQSDEEYSYTLSDGTVIDQLRYSGGYVEKILPPTGWFYTYKEYNPNARLRMAGRLFRKGDFKAGKWFETTIFGFKKITDYDAPFRMNVEKILHLSAAAKNINLYDNDVLHAITRKHLDNQSLWYVQYKIRHDRIHILVIDDKTGKIIKESSYLFEDD